MIEDKQIIFELAYHPLNDMFLCSATKKRYVLEGYPSSRHGIVEYNSYQNTFRPITPPYVYEQHPDRPCAHHFDHHQSIGECLSTITMGRVRSQC